VSARRSFRKLDSLRLVPVILSIAVSMLTAGCSTMSEYVPNLRSLGVYKLDINQGNYITQDQVDKLKQGMTKQQVRTVLGTPLVTSAFRENRWDYVYEFRRQGVTQEHRTFAVFFAEDKLARWEGDELPTSAVELNRSATEKSLKAESHQESGFMSWIRGVFGGK
jgi:outer membrane protein assembly factor BamE